MKGLNNSKTSSGKDYESQSCLVINRPHFTSLVTPKEEV